MSTNQTDIRFTGNRAFRWDNRCMRWMPIAAAKAALLIATGSARDITGTDWV